MLILSCFFLVLFIFNEIFYVYNKTELDSLFADKNLSALSKLELVYYLLRVLYWVFLGLGLFSSHYILFLILIVFRFLKFPLFHINKKLYIVWNNILPIISIIMMLIILFFKIKG